jgi:hypothetical protein
MRCSYHCRSRFLARQLEIYFSILQRKLLTPSDVDDVQPRLLAFEPRYHHAATAFEWNDTGRQLW